MTDDDRQDTRQGGAQGEDEIGALLGGLLDGLPESGHGAGGEVPANPFRDPAPASGQDSEPSPPTDAPPPTGLPVSTDADPDPLGLASPMGLLAPTQQTWHAGDAEAEGVPDEPAPTGPEAPASEARAEQMGAPEPGTQAEHGADHEVSTGHAPTDADPGSRAGHVPWDPTSGAYEAREAQGAHENDESAGTHHASGVPVGGMAPSGVSGRPEMLGEPGLRESAPDADVSAGGDAVPPAPAAPVGPAEQGNASGAPSPDILGAPEFPGTHGNASGPVTRGDHVEEAPSAGAAVSGPPEDHGNHPGRAPVGAILDEGAPEASDAGGIRKVHEDARVAGAPAGENAVHDTHEARENVSAPEAPGVPAAPSAPAAHAGGQVPGTHTSPDPPGVPQAGAAAPPAADPRSTYGAPGVPGTPGESANTVTGGVGGNGGHVVPAVAGGHSSGTDGNTEPYGIRAYGMSAALGKPGSDAPSDATPDAGPDVVDAPGHAEERSPSEGAHGVTSAPDDVGEPAPPEDARGVSEARVNAASGDAGSPGDPSAAPPAGAEDTQTPSVGEPTQEGAQAPASAETPAEVAQGNVPPASAVPADHVSTADAPEHAAPQEHTTTLRGRAYADAEREAVYRAIRERRDVHSGFRPDPVADDLLTRILEAAHQAPSVGDTKPWDFLVIDDHTLRTRLHGLARDEREEHARSHPGARAQAFSGLGAEAILEAPLNIAVTVDPTRGPHHTPGHHTGPMSAPHSAVLAVENLWLAARAEGLGVGWVSFLDERDVARALDLPPHLDVVAYLCVGRVDEFPTEPELGLGGWVKERPLSWAVHHDRYGRRGLPGQEPTSLLEETIAAIGGLSARAVEEARDRQSRMTKPQGALGVLEEVSVRLAGLSGECPPPIPEPAAVAIFAGDHGVHAQGVTPWPQEVTAQMVHTFLSGGAVVNAFAEQVGADVTVVDVGVAADLPSASGLLPRKVARGTADSTQGPAMTRPQALQALETGIEVARDLVASGHRCLVTGDMGIANTTPSAALICAYTGAAPEDATGTGAGADKETHSNKVDVVRRMLAANPVEPSDPVGTLAALGGLEHAALAGFVLGGAAMRVPVLLDGVIAGSSALTAVAISPESAAACFAGHRSSEPGHAAALEHLGLPPLVDLEMRVGEGSGALLALPLLQASARALRSVATFEDSGIVSAG